MEFSVKGVCGGVCEFPGWAVSKVCEFAGWVWSKLPDVGFEKAISNIFKATVVEPPAAVVVVDEAVVQQQAAAAPKIQKMVRGFIVRNKVAKEAKAAAELKAAAVVQQPAAAPAATLKPLMRWPLQTSILRFRIPVGDDVTKIAELYKSSVNPKSTVDDIDE